MKKFLKVFSACLLVLLVLGAIALAVCYITIPDRTKSAMDIVINYLDKPLFIGGGTTITVGLVLGLLIKYAFSSYSQRNKLQLEEYEKRLTAFQSKISDLTNKLEERINECSNECANNNEEIGNMVDQLQNLCELIPNVKVKEFGKQLKEHLGESYGEERTND